MIRKSLLVFVLLAFSLCVSAADGLVEKSSPHSVADTVKRVTDLLEKKGIRVFAIVEHRQNAKTVDLELSEVTVIMFGNPRLGTPLMQSNPSIGIDLPMKIVVWEDSAGKVHLAYNDPSWLAARHGISDREEVVKKMTAALGNITDKVVSP